MPFFILRGGRAIDPRACREKKRGRRGSTGKWSTVRNKVSRPVGIALDSDGREYDRDTIEFMFACYRELRRLQVFSLTPRQILCIAKSLGYRRL